MIMTSRFSLNKVVVTNSAVGWYAENWYFEIHVMVLKTDMFVFISPREQRMFLRPY